LTPEGTEYFENLDDRGRKNFYMKLRQELADAIPVSLERISTNGKFETDSSIPPVFPKQIILYINIEEDKTKQGRSVNLLIETLDSLIKNKPITVIAFGETSRYIEAYGYLIRKNSLLK